MKIQAKIQWFAVTLLLTVIFMISIAVYSLFAHLLVEKELEQLDIQTANIAAFIKPDPDLPQNPINMLRAYLPVNGMIRIIDEAASPFLTVSQRPELAHIPAQYHTGQVTATHEAQEGEQLAVSYFPIIWTDGSIVTLEVTASLQHVQDTLNLLKLVFVAASFVMIIPAVIGSMILSKLILNPLQAIIRTMQEIQESGAFKKIQLNRFSKDELHQMADAFNHMIELLKRNFERQQQFVSDASHELKTPLTVIESYTNLLKRWGAKKPEILEESIEAIHSESTRMKQLTEQMLALSEDHSANTLHLEQTDVRTLVQEAAETIAATHAREIRVHIPDRPVPAVIDISKMRQVLRILLDNALKYSEKPIDLRVSQDLRHILIEVRDYGIGIPADQLERVFDRFFRVDDVRSRKTGGTGLGLSIAQNIVQAHNGQIVVESEIDRGSLFTVRLPRPKPT